MWPNSRHCARLSHLGLLLTLLGVGDGLRSPSSGVGRGRRRLGGGRLSLLSVVVPSDPRDDDGEEEEEGEPAVRAPRRSASALAGLKRDCTHQTTQAMLSSERKRPQWVRTQRVPKALQRTREHELWLRATTRPEAQTRLMSCSDAAERVSSFL